MALVGIYTQQGPVYHVYIRQFKKDLWYLGLCYMLKAETKHRIVSC